MRQLTTFRREAPFVEALLVDHAIFHLEADLRWIEVTSARLDQLAKELQR
jgi:hypothetical protein